MVIWLNSRRLTADAGARDDPDGPAVRFGVHGDVVRRETFGDLLSIAHAYAQLEADRALVLAQAQDEAAAIVAAGEEQAELLLDAASETYETAAKRGYREGANRALTEWMERLADATDAQNRLQVRMRERGGDHQADAEQRVDGAVDQSEKELREEGVEEIVHAVTLRPTLRRARATPGIRRDRAPRSPGLRR